MTFTNPNIVLNGKDGWTLTIGKESIVPTSFKEEQKLMNDLSPSSNKVSVEISDWNKVSEIMTRQEDLRATFYDGSTPIFSGYLSNKSTWQLTDSGIKKMSLTFEDVGTRLLGKTFLPSATGEEYVDTTLYEFTKRICTRCGIVLSSSSARNVSIKALVSGRSTCKEILNQVMKETGYVYSFDNYGRMYLYEIPSTANTSYTFDSSNLWTQNSSAVKSDRNIRKYERTRLEFDEYENAVGITVYKDISGKDEEYRNCKIEIPSKGTYPDRTNGLPSTYSCTDIQTGKDIVSISNLTPLVESIGDVVVSIEKKNSKDISVLITNNTTTNATVTKLEATADAVMVKGTTVLLSGEAVEDSASDNVYEMKLTYIHTKDEAENTAKVLDWYYKYSDYSYEFYSKDDLDVGSVVRVNDDSISGLDVVVLITDKVIKGNTNIITYKGVAYSPFKTTVIKDTTVNRPPVIIQGGSDGKDGTSISISSTSVTYQTSSSGTTVPTGNWETSIPSLSQGQYLWTKTVVNYSPSGSTTSYSVSYIGNDGSNGDSVSISSTSVTYQLSDSGTTVPTGEWSTSVPTLTEGKYLWTKTVVNYNPSGSTTSYSVSYIGNDGTSVTISSTSVTYQLSDSGNVTPTGEWSTSVPTLTKGKYLWTKTVVNYNPSGSTTSYSVSYIGNDGKDGVDGNDGEDAKLFTINPYSTTITKDLRSSSTQTIRADVLQSGYKGDIHFESNYGTVTGVTGSYTVVLPMNLDSVTFLAYSIVPSSGSYSSDIPYFEKTSDGKYKYKEVTSSNYLSYYMAEVWTEVVLSSVDVTNYKQYLGVYDTVASIPLSNALGSVIDGDYALVRKNQSGNFSLTAYERHNGDWIVTSDPQILAETTSDAVNEAKAEYEKGGNVNYLDLFYSHKAYIDNLSSTVINVSNIYAGDIESFDYTEDSNGNPTKGYKLEYKGGNDGSGIIKSVGMKARDAVFKNSTIERDCQVYGTLVNQDEDGNIVLKTEQSNLAVSTMRSTRTDGSSTPNAFLWSEYRNSLLSSINALSSDTWYSATSTSINGTSIKGVYKKTSVAPTPSKLTVYGPNSGSYSQAFKFDYFHWILDASGNSLEVSITIPSNYPRVFVKRLTLKRPYWGDKLIVWPWESQTYSCGDGIVYDNGNVMFGGSGYGLGGNGRYVVEERTNFYFYPGHTYKFRLSQGTTTNVNHGTIELEMYEADTWKTGINFINSNDDCVLFDSVVPSSGWGTSAQSYNCNGVSKNLAFSASASWSITKYYTFQWDSAPSSSTNKTTSFIADGSTLSYKGTTLNSSQIGSATFSTSGITMVSSSGNSYQFSVGSYYTQYNVRLTTQDSLLGIYAKNLMPVNTESRIGGSDSAHLWNAIYCNTIYSNNSAPVSKRSLKENIKDWDGGALELLKGVNVVEYNYISDPDKTYHIGFIADDTDERIAGKDHDRMDTTNCIGVLIKAIQELSDKVSKLESQTNSNGSDL